MPNGKGSIYLELIVLASGSSKTLKFQILELLTAIKGKLGPNIVVNIYFCMK